MRIILLATLLAAAGCKDGKPSGSADKAPESKSATGSASATVARNRTAAAKPPDAPADPTALLPLLDRYADALGQLAKAGSADAIPPELTAQEEERRRLEARGGVSPNFARRHQRLLQITRLIAATPAAQTSQPARAEIDSFVKAVKGPDASIDPAGGLAALGPVLLEELINLHLLVEPTADRDELRARYAPDSPSAP